IGLFCNIPHERVIPALDVKSIYEVPLTYHAEGLDTEVLSCFGIKDAKEPDLTQWQEIVHRIKNPEASVKIGIVGKYTELTDSYKSLNEALIHGGIANNVKVQLKFLEGETFEKDGHAAELEDVDAILVPGGFGQRGTEGMIKAVEFARTRKVPYFGICFGMQMAVIEATRHLVGLEEANSTEFGECKEPVVGLMTEWLKGNEMVTRDDKGDLGGTMRLGAYNATLKPDSLISKIYGSTTISERHRHRYEVNINYVERLEAKGMEFAGMSPNGKLPETVEIPGHPWFIGVQYHPELKSKPFDPHPLFTSFIGAALEKSRLV
ncbi:MAG: CTP synthase, partial [Micavibrio aeruginosavorus]